MALTEKTRLGFGIGTAVIVFVTLFTGGYNLRSWADQISNAGSVNDKQTEAISQLTSAQQSNQYQTQRNTESIAQLIEAQRVRDERARKVEDAILLISNRIRLEQRDDNR